MACTVASEARPPRTLLGHVRASTLEAGWPFAEDLIALLSAHPQVFVDTGIIDWAYPVAARVVLTAVDLSTPARG